MYYLYDTGSGCYVVAIGVVRRQKSTMRVLYFEAEPRGARWATRKGAENALEKIRRADETAPAGIAGTLKIVEVR